MKNLFNPAKTVQLNLDSVPKNGYDLTVEFQKYALKQGWKEDEIAKVIFESMRGNSYSRMLLTFKIHCC